MWVILTLPIWSLPMLHVPFPSLFSSLTPPPLTTYLPGYLLPNGTLLPPRFSFSFSAFMPSLNVFPPAPAIIDLINYSTHTLSVRCGGWQHRVISTLQLAQASHNAAQGARGSYTLSVAAACCLAAPL